MAVVGGWLGNEQRLNSQNKKKRKGGWQCQGDCKAKVLGDTKKSMVEGIPIKYLPSINNKIYKTKLRSPRRNEQIEFWKNVHSV